MNGSRPARAREHVDCANHLELGDFLSPPRSVLAFLFATLVFSTALAVEPAAAQPRAPQAAESTDPVRVVRRVVVTDNFVVRTDAPKPTHRLRLEAAVLNGTGWTIESVLEAVRAAASMLGQCGIVLERLALNEVDAPASYRSLDTPYSRQLVRALDLAKPTLYFVADTAHRPAFDAEAIGRANSRTRPEMADTVWITARTRDVPIVIAHELAHVLADSGEHSDAPGNLMRDATEPDNVRLTAAQCGALVETGEGNRLLEGIGR